jgi:hypothetical protein
MSDADAVLAAIGAIAALGLRSGWSAWSGRPRTRSTGGRPPGDVLHALDSTTIELVNPAGPSRRSASPMRAFVNNEDWAPAGGRGEAERRARMAATAAQEYAERMRSRITTPSTPRRSACLATLACQEIPAPSSWWRRWGEVRAFRA